MRGIGLWFPRFRGLGWVSVLCLLWAGSSLCCLGRIADLLDFNWFCGAWGWFSVIV